MTPRLTGTGWPGSLRQTEVRDLTTVKRALTLAQSTGYESLSQDVRTAVGLVDGRTFAEIVPLSSTARRALADVLGVDDLEALASTHESNFLNSVRRCMANAAERREAHTCGQSAAIAEAACLYRFRDDCGRLLYVGISRDPDVRERQHRASQRWAPLIAEREDEWFDSRANALKAEADAIRDESPLFNEAGRPRLPAPPPEVFA